MGKNIKNFGLCWVAAAVLTPLWVAACSGPDLSLGGSAGASGSAGAGGAGTGGTASSGTGGGAQQSCEKSACGPQLGLPNQICADGSTGGPTGRCLKNNDGSCGWEVLQCPPDNGSGGGANGGAPAMGGAPSGACGGETCNADQVCCGPAEGGHCISKLSKQACLPMCPGGSGGSGGSGGAPDCAALLANVNTTQAAAQACNPASARPTLECAGAIEGLCCPISVENASPTAPANAAYLAALRSYKADCAQACLLTPCIEPQPGDCRASSRTSGQCGPQAP